jgi:hypothetical protein
MPSVTAFQDFGEVCVLVDEQPARQAAANVRSAIVDFILVYQWSAKNVCDRRSQRVIARFQLGRPILRHEMASAV